MHADDTHLATDPYRSAAAYQLRVPIRLYLATIDGNAATDERSRRRLTVEACGARGIAGPFTQSTQQPGLAATVCSTTELAVSVSPHSRSRSGRRINTDSRSRTTCWQDDYPPAPFACRQLIVVHALTSRIFLLRSPRTPGSIPTDRQSRARWRSDRYPSAPQPHERLAPSSRSSLR
jgi:hypothetical protein